MRRMNSRFLLHCILLITAHSLSAQPLWELGARELGMGQGVELSSEPIRSAASSNGHIIAWKQGRDVLTEGVVSRLSAAGQVLDPTGINLGKVSEYGPIVLGSDGEGYLIATSSPNSILFSSIGERGEVTQNATTLHGTPWVLSWNGRVYLFVMHSYATSPGGSFAMLVDRKGNLVSGKVFFKDTWWQSFSTATFNGSWVVAWTMTYNGARRPAALAIPLQETMFPPIGESTVLSPQILFEDSSGIAIAADTQGYVIAARGTLQRLDAASLFASSSLYSGRTPGRRPLPRQTPAADAIPIPNCSNVKELAIEGSSAFVACTNWSNGKSTARLVRIENGRATQMLEPSLAREATISISSAGPLAAWIDAKDHQVYAAPARGSIWSAETHLLSGAFAWQRDPRIASGGNVHLATWIDERKDLGTVQLTFTILAPDGRPLTEPKSLGVVNQWFPSHGVASDGSSFLVVWQRGADLFGAIVLADGTIAHGPFFYIHSTYIARLDALSWDGQFYNVRMAGVLLRINRDGMPEHELDARNYGESWPTYLLPEGDRLLGIDEETSWGPCTCGATMTWRTRFFDRDLTHSDDDPPDVPSDDPWDGQEFEIFTWDPHVAVAAGGGHRLIVANGNSHDAPMYVIGDDARIKALDYGPRHLADFYEPWSAVWTGSGFAVSAGSVLAMHAPDGALSRFRSLPPETMQTAVGANPGGSLVVLAERRVGTSHRLAAFRLAP